jgi:hypothetical protein
MKKVLAFCAALTAFGACEDERDLVGPASPPAAVPPMIGHAPDGAAATPLSFDDVLKAGLPPTKPTITRGGVRPPTTVHGPVELRQSRLDTWPTFGSCPNFGAPAGAGWVQLFYFQSPYSAAYPTGQPNNCQQQPPNSNVPYLTPYLYPSGISMNDQVRAFFGWVNYLQCLKVTFKEHDWGGATLVYQACNTTPNTYSYVWSGNIQGDAGFSLGVTNVTVEWQQL